MEKLTNQEDVIQFCQSHDFPADIVGKWIWLGFLTKPTKAVRTLLTEAGFCWVNKRGQWAHSCGGYTWRRSNTPYEPRDIYGSIPVSEVEH